MIYDHHCYLINNCIGEGNFKYYFCFVFYCLILLTFTIFSMIPTLNFYYIEYGYKSFHFLSFLSAIIVNIIITLCVGYLAYFQIGLIRVNMTIYEYNRSIRNMVRNFFLIIIKRFTKSNTWNELMMTKKKFNTLEEFKKRLGKNVIMWFFPFKIDEKSR